MKRTVTAILVLSLAGCGLAETRKAKDLVGEKLKDPESAVFTNVVSHEGNVCGMVNSKNGFGAMAGAVPFFVTSDGSASLAPTMPDVSNERLEQMRSACYGGQGDGFSYACQSYRAAFAEQKTYLDWMSVRAKLCGDTAKP